jgi:hypothetical protein
MLQLERLEEAVMGLVRESGRLMLRGVIIGDEREREL